MLPTKPSLRLGSGGPRGRALMWARGTVDASCVGTASTRLRFRVPPYSARLAQRSPTDSCDSRQTPRLPATHISARPRSISETITDSEKPREMGRSQTGFIARPDEMRATKQTQAWCWWPARSGRTHRSGVE